MEETAAKVERRKTEAQASGERVVPRRRATDWAKAAGEAAEAKATGSKRSDEPVAAEAGRT